MMRSIDRCVGALIGLSVVLMATAASAQVIGTFRWQFAPYCNVVTLTVVQEADAYRLNGFDDMCGVGKRGAASGTAHLNPDGTVGIGITVIRPDGLSVQHAAAISLAALSGAWSDEYGNGGTFAFNAPSPSPGSPRPLTARGDYAARGHATTSATGVSALADISFGRALSFVPQGRVIQLGAATTADCPGTPDLPRAAPGFLCLYERSQSNRQTPVLFDSNFFVDVADRFGAVLYVGNAGAGPFGSSGTWAVTVP